MNLKRTPRKARVTRGGISAWWYDERKGISVHIQSQHCISSLFIRRSDLRKYLERSK